MQLSMNKRTMQCVRRPSWLTGSDKSIEQSIQIKHDESPPHRQDFRGTETRNATNT